MPCGLLIFFAESSCFPEFFMVQAFQSSDFSGSRFFRVQAFLDPSFSGSRVQVQGLGSGPKVWVQLLEVAVLNSMICFSVRFCDSSLLLLKMRFQSFLSQEKRYKGFLVMGRYYRCYQCSFIYKIVSQFFEILIFSQDIWGNVHLYLKSTSFPKGLL